MMCSTFSFRAGARAPGRPWGALDACRDPPTPGTTLTRPSHPTCPCRRRRQPTPGKSGPPTADARLSCLPHAVVRHPRPPLPAWRQPTLVDNRARGSLSPLVRLPSRWRVQTAAQAHPARPKERRARAVSRRRSSVAATRASTCTRPASGPRGWRAALCPLCPQGCPAWSRPGCTSGSASVQTAGALEAGASGACTAGGLP